MGKGKLLSDFEKARIVACYEKNVPAKFIAEVLGRPQTTISAFYSNFKINFDLPPKTKVSKGQISGAMGLAIKKLAGEANSMGIRAIAAQLKNELPNESWYPSRTTIQRYLARQGLVHKKSTLKPPLNATNSAKRLAFATEWLANGLESTGIS